MKIIRNPALLTSFTNRVSSSRRGREEEGEGRDRIEFSRRISWSLPKATGKRARFTCITIWIRNPRNSRGELLVISWWFHGNLADRNAINRWFSWKSRPVTLYTLFSSLLRARDDNNRWGWKKKIVSLFREENFQAEFFINYNIISPWIEYANSTVIECIFNFQKWSRRRKMINLEFRRMFHCIDFTSSFYLLIC